jgi:serine protease Do
MTKTRHNSRWLQRLAIICSFAAVLLTISVDVRADEPTDKERSGISRFFGFRMERNRRDSRQVREAFREVVADATAATVEVLCDNRRAALGAIVASDGLVLTKASELTGEVKCRLKSGEVYSAELVATTSDFDLAVLKVDAKELPVIRWRTNLPLVGSWLATPGTSDIPRAIGVVSVAVRKIPAQRGMLGVRLDDPPDGKQGALIIDVVDRSAADRARMRDGDRVTHLDGWEIEGGYRGFMNRMANKKAADIVNLKISRGDDVVDMNIVLMPLPALQRNLETEIEVDGRLSVNRWGFERVLQHDSLLDPTDCGGPIVALDGGAIGINIARAARVASYAIPASDAIKFLDEYKAGKHLVLPKEKKPDDKKTDDKKTDDKKTDEKEAVK